MREADIVVCAAGRAEMVKADWIKPGAAVIDVGINSLDDPTSKKGWVLILFSTAKIVRHSYVEVVCNPFVLLKKCFHNNSKCFVIHCYCRNANINPHFVIPSSLSQSVGAVLK